MESGVPVKLEAISELSETTRTFRFLRVDGNPVQYIPGQFYRFLLSDEKGTFERSYSLCNLGADVPRNALDLVISKVDKGRATRLFFKDGVDLSAQVSGPYGKLILPEELSSRIIMVCTSVGIAPFLPMLDQIFRIESVKHRSIQVHLFFGIRTEEECLYRNYLKNLAKENSSFSVDFCFSKALPKKPLDSDSRGYVQERMKSITLDQNSDLVYLCGNPQMIDETYLYLKEKGFSSKKVKREKYVFAKDLTAGDKNRSSKSMSDEDRLLLEEKIRKYQKQE